MGNSFSRMALVIAMSSCAVSAALTVDAGADVTTIVGPWASVTGFSGSVTSDDTASYVAAWTKRSGPALGDSIYYPDAQGSKLQFYKPGVYRYLLTVTLGAEVQSDTVKFTVQDSLPLKVLSPSANEKMQRGKPFVFNWQIDPLEASPKMKIYISIDGGKSFIGLKESQTVPPCTLTIPDTLAYSTNCIVKLQKYFISGRSVVSSVFSLIEPVVITPPAAKKSGCGSGAGLAIIPPILFKLAKKRKKKVA